MVTATGYYGSYWPPVLWRLLVIVAGTGYSYCGVYWPLWRLLAIVAATFADVAALLAIGCGVNGVRKKITRGRFCSFMYITYMRKVRAF